MKHKSGYTLLEMSIVLVIIGIAIGGIFIAQTLIRSSYLNRVLEEYDTYIKSTKEFQDKFLAYPGDMTNAEAMWGTDPGGCPNSPSSTTPKIATCNGNGDGKIGDSTATGTLSNQREWFRAWQQLSDASLIDNQYTGIPGSGGVAEAVPMVNVPSSSMSGAGWTIHYFQMVGANTGLWADQYSHMLDFGVRVTADRTIGPVLSPTEAIAMDTKVDDGKPGRGMIRAWRTSVLPNCTSSDTTQDAQAYNTTTTAQVCSLVFLLSF